MSSQRVSAGLPQHLAGLLDPASYSHPARDIRVVETHTSWVILTGDYAYKIKRPVRFPFLDFTTLARRELFCQEELRLNRRFAAPLYLQVCPVVQHGARVQMNGVGEVIEFAVRMRQFDAAAELGTLLEHGQVTIADIEDFAVALARIHRTLPQLPSNREPQRTTQLLLENAAQCMAATAGDTACARVRQCAWQMRDELARLGAVLARRDQEGFVRECHGDLHVSNVARIDGCLQAFDCLEYEPEFRRIDVAQEIAFLAMDLAAHSRSTLASAFLNAWLSETGDYHACECLNLYEAHCALVRAKVTALNAARAAGHDRIPLLDRQRALIGIAHARLQRDPPLLILMQGLSGSGKSWLAQRLARELPAISIRSDLERRRLAGLAPQAQSGAGVASGLYAPSVSDEVYQHMAGLARAVLRGARHVIVDAAFLRRSSRRLFAALATEYGLVPVVVACEAPLPTLRARIERRGARGDDPSEATLEVLEWQRQHAEPIAADEGLEVIVADTGARPLHDVLTRLTELGLPRGA
jgi:aminoglycoside phosphotransferase family enzyme/predicted kinase